MSRQVFRPDASQVRGIELFVRKSFAGLFWPPGLGKTATFLAAMEILRSKNMFRRALVISKPKVISNTWPREIEKWDVCRNMTYAICRGGEGRRVEALESGADFVLMNLENVEWFVGLVKGVSVKRRGRRVILPADRPDLMRFDVLNCDESSKFRNSGTKRFKALQRVLPEFRRRYIMTGSPAPRSLMNLWAQMFILDLGELLGEYITHYRQTYFHPAGFRGRDWEINEGSSELIYRRVAKRVLRIGDGALEMPPLPPPINRMVYLDEEQRQIYRQMERDAVLEIAGETITAANAGVKTAKLRQIANGRVYLTPEKKPDGKKVRRESVRVHDAKAQDLLDLIEETQGTPALIGYEHHSDLEAILEVLGQDTPVIKGGTSDEESDEIIDRWNAGELTTLVCQYDVVAHGLNMQDVHAIVVYYGIPWDLEVYEQFYRRVWRRGQKKAVLRYHVLVHDSVDDKVCLPGIVAKDDRQQTLLRELEKFMERRKKFTRPESLVGIGNKAGMVLIRDTMIECKQTVPKLRREVKDPGGVLLSMLHKRARGWGPETSAKFCAAASGQKDYEGPSDQKTVLAMVSEIMCADVEKPITEATYKMWPGGTQKGGEPEEEETDMATKKAKKKAGKKTGFAKAASAKKASRKKSGKKTSVKKTTTKSAKGALTLIAVKDAPEPKMEARQQIVAKAKNYGAKGVKSDVLSEWAEKELEMGPKRAAAHVQACVANGFLKRK